MEWVKSSFCAKPEMCVEVFRHQDSIMIRESETPHLVVYTTPEKWEAFVKGVKAGDFDNV